MAEVQVVSVYLWGVLVGAVEWIGDAARGHARFQYSEDFADYKLEVSPEVMPVDPGVTYEFANLASTKTFAGLPGLLADSLPEKFGNKIMTEWLARRGLSFEELTPVERLCYQGRRAMGALEFEPDLDPEENEMFSVDVPELVEVARRIMDDRNESRQLLKEGGERVDQLISIGTSAGGAKAKAVIALSEDRKEVISGQADCPDGFEHWLLKFTDVKNSEQASDKYIGLIEYAYYLMACDAGIDMMECDLFTDGQNSHFMTKRFDRIDNQKVHVQTFCGLSQIDRDPPGNASYAQLFASARKLGLGQDELNQLYRRMVFNILSRNQDDHGRKFAFMMGGDGQWRLTPAYDLCYAFEPDNKFISVHQMKCNEKRTNFVLSDLVIAAKDADVKKPMEIIEAVRKAIFGWDDIADKTGVPEEVAVNIKEHFRTNII